MWWSVLSLLDNPHDRGLKPSPLPRGVQIAGVAAFVALVLVSGLFALTDHWRRATFALGVGMLWYVVIRWACDSKILGVLAVRSRLFDVCYAAAVGVLMVFLSASVDSLGS